MQVILKWTLFPEAGLCKRKPAYCTHCLSVFIKLLPFNLSTQFRGWSHLAGSDVFREKGISFIIRLICIVFRVCGLKDLK